MKFPELLEDWDCILRKAWSIKFNAAAVVFGIADVAITQWPQVGIPNGLLAGVAVVSAVGGLIARVLAQSEDNAELIKELAQEIERGKLPQ